MIIIHCCRVHCALTEVNSMVSSGSYNSASGFVETIVCQLRSLLCGLKQRRSLSLDFLTVQPVPVHLNSISWLRFSCTKKVQIFLRGLWNMDDLLLSICRFTTFIEYSLCHFKWLWQWPQLLTVLWQLSLSFNAVAGRSRTQIQDSRATKGWTQGGSFNAISKLK